MSTRGQAKWIWASKFNDADEELPGKFVLFRKTVKLEQIPSTACNIHVSADTRYRLFVNGKSVAFGPCKSYPTRWYYETIDVSSFLRVGSNVIAAQVLRFFPGQIGSSSLMKANVPGFILWGQIGDQPLATDETWLCHEDTSIRLQPRSQWNYILGPPFLSLDERVDFSKALLNWRDETVDQSSWSSAVPAVAPIKMMPAMEPWKLFERPIPLLPEVPKSFQGALKCSGSPSLEAWNSLIKSQSEFSIRANETLSVEFESSDLTTGFLEFDFTGGKGAEISILYAEAYERDLGKDKAPFPLPRHKSNRRDYENGRLYGNEDFVTLSAAEGQQTRYEPFWFRTFRFIRLIITCKNTPVTIQRIAFRETLYPLEISTNVNLPNTIKPVWDMCINTLQKCMHETYEDCPFYEQNQFAMDGRLQLLFTYQLSRDDRLARKTIHEFHASRRDDGLLETNYPVSMRAINIPQFSLFWIFMLHDHMMYFGDGALIRRYISTADGILEHFHSLLNASGLVGAFDAESWAFIDWVKAWHGTKGIRDMAVPPIYKTTGVAAYNSLLYSWTLQHAADLAEFIHRPDTASEYRTRAESLNTAVRKHCFNGTFFLDGPGATEISEHTQIFAVLSNAITGPDAADLLHRTMNHEDIPRCSYAMKHYVFRALSKTGLYAEYFPAMMETWYQMVRDNLTTCAEDDVSFRSDCHGWSASPIYEVVAEVYGLRPVEPGMRKVRVVPRRELLGVDMEGAVGIGEVGGVRQGEEEMGGRGELRYTLPSGEAIIRWEGTGEIDVQIHNNNDQEKVLVVKDELTNGV